MFGCAKWQAEDKRRQEKRRQEKRREKEVDQKNIVILKKCLNSFHRTYQSYHSHID